MRQNLTNMTPMLFSSIRSPFILLVLVWSRLDINLITFNRVFPTGGSSIPHVVFITLFWEIKRFKLNSLKWINKKPMCRHRRPANITPFLCERNLTFRQNLNKKSETSTYCKRWMSALRSVMNSLFLSTKRVSVTWNHKTEADAVCSVRKEWQTKMPCPPWRFYTSPPLHLFPEPT